jgi:rare lipoprotein A
VSHYRTSAAFLLAAGLGVGSARADIASWYGAFHEGRPMANGCIFHRRLLSAAHRTLPLGSWIRVRANGRTLDVPITDRGPYIGGRALDLSEAAFAYLDRLAAGLVMMTFEPLPNHQSKPGCRSR